MQRRLYALFSAMFLSFLCFNVHATPITFDLTSPSESYHSQLNYSFNGLELNIWGSAQNKSSTEVHQNIDGLGVYFDSDNSKQLDNSGPDEFLVFSFNQTVQLLAVGFGLVSTNDDFALTIDGSEYLEGNITSSATSLISDRALLDFENRWLTGNLFSFQPLAGTDYFKLSEITVASVPEPSTALLALLGMCIFMFIRYIILVFQLTD